MNSFKKNIPGVKVLLYKDGREYVAHILDFDLVGTGATRQEAITEASEAAAAQIAYALEHSCIDKIFKSAPESFYKAWEESGRHAIMNILISAERKTSPALHSRTAYEALELPVSDLCPSFA